MIAECEIVAEAVQAEALVEGLPCFEMLEERLGGPRWRVEREELVDAVGDGSVTAWFEIGGQRRRCMRPGSRIRL